MLGERLHRVERDLLGAGGGTDVGVDAAVAQTLDHAAAFDAEHGGDGVGIVPAHLHHARERLELVERIHRLLRHVLGHGDRGCRRGIVVDGPAADLGPHRPALGILVIDEVQERGPPAAAGDDAPDFAGLLHDGRVKEPQRIDRRREIGDVVVLVGVGRARAGVQVVQHQVLQRHVDVGQFGRHRMISSPSSRPDRPHLEKKPSLPFRERRASVAAGATSRTGRGWSGRDTFGPDRPGPRRRSRDPIGRRCRS